MGPMLSGAAGAQIGEGLKERRGLGLCTRSDSKGARQADIADEDVAFQKGAERGGGVGQHRAAEAEAEANPEAAEAAAASAKKTGGRSGGAGASRPKERIATAANPIRRRAV